MRRIVKVAFLPALVLGLTFLGGVTFGGADAPVQFGPQPAVASDCQNDVCTDLGSCEPKAGSGKNCDEDDDHGCSESACDLKPTFQ